MAIAKGTKAPDFTLKSKTAGGLVDIFRGSGAINRIKAGSLRGRHALK